MKASVLNKIEAVSSQGRQLGCPACRRELVLEDLKDGDQAYWCMTCEAGWRVGSLPPAALQDRQRRAPEGSPEPIAVAASEPVRPPRAARRLRDRAA